MTSRGDRGMTDPSERLIRVAPSMSAFTPAEWGTLAGTTRDGAGETAYNPFISLAFLSSLEDSGCVGRKTGPVRNRYPGWLYA